MGKTIRFDVMIGEKFIKTLSMPCGNGYAPLSSMREYAEQRLPMSLKGKDFQIYPLD